MPTGDGCVGEGSDVGDKVLHAPPGALARRSPFFGCQAAAHVEQVVAFGA
jgi:hypothetical protein